MPRYDYQCSSCEHVFEMRQSFDSEPLADCPLCAGQARRKFQVVPIIYKGSGFYTTDYKKAGYSGDSNAKKDEAKEEKEEKESTSSSKSSKSATATESKEETASPSH